MTKAGKLFEQLDLTKAGYFCAGVVFVLSFILYYVTLAPTVTFVDSGELLLAAKTAGVAHPPGFPLYVMLAHVASLMPWGTLATRVHLLSALFAALAAAVMTLVVIEATQTVTTAGAKKKPKTHSKKKARLAADVQDQSAKDAGPAGVSGEQLISVLGPAIAAGLLFGSSRTLWAYANIAEVYTLNAFLIAVVFWLMFGWRRQSLNAQAEQTVSGDLRLYIAAVVFGLAIGVHHVTVALTLPALAFLVYSTEGKSFYLSRRFIYAWVFAFAGLTVYIYLPIAASRSPLMNWGDPRTFERFWWHVTGWQYQSFFDLSFSRLTEFFKLVSREFSHLWVPLALGYILAGFVYLFRRDKVMFWFLSLVGIAEIAYCLSYEISEDKDAYYLPVFMALVIASSFGMRWFITAAQKFNEQKALIQAAAGASLLIVPLVALSSNYAFNNRSRYYLAHDYVDNIFRSIEPRGMLLTGDWQTYAPTLYVRDIEDQRKDIIVLDTNLLRRTWYYDYLDQVYPQLTAGSRDKINAFLVDLVAFNRDPEAFRRNDSLNQRINQHFNDVLAAFVNAQIKEAPVYVTLDLTDPKGETDIASIMRSVSDKYEFIPQGLVFRVGEKFSGSTLQEPQIKIRGLNDGTLKFENDDVVKRKVEPVYLAMLTNTGTYLASRGQHQRAIAQFELALKIDPTSELAKNALAASRYALRTQ